MGLMVTKKTPEIPKPQSNNGGRRDFLQRPVSNQKVNRRCYICHSPNHISTTCPERDGKTPVRNTPRVNTCQAESVVRKSPPTSVQEGLTLLCKPTGLDVAEEMTEKTQNDEIGENSAIDVARIKVCEKVLSDICDDIDNYVTNSDDCAEVSK